MSLSLPVLGWVEEIIQLVYRRGSRVVPRRMAGGSHAQEIFQRQGHDLDGGGRAQIQAVRLQPATQTVPFLGGSSNLLET